MILFRLLIIMIVISVTACAGTSAKLTDKDVAQYREKQLLWLSSLKEGIAPEAAIKEVTDYQQYFFKYMHNGKNYQYSQGKFPVTGTLFGLFFEDEKLTSLLLDQSVTDFTQCRKYGYQYSWPYKGFIETAKWVNKNNLIGMKYDDIKLVSPNYSQKNKKNSKSSAVEIITHIPLAIMALPFYGAYKLTGFPSDKDNGFDNHSKKIELGITKSNQLQKIVGNPPPGGKSINKEMEVWRYNSIRFYIKNGIVTFMESTNWHYLPLNNLTVIRDMKCIDYNNN